MLKVSKTAVIEKIDYLPAVQVFQSLLRQPYGFFLDSNSRSARLGRYSFIGVDPFLVYRSHGDFFKIETPHSNWTQTSWRRLEQDPFETLRALWQKYSLPKTDLLPLVGGAVGFFSYDLGRFLERLPDKGRNDLNLPDCCLGFYDTILAFDHVDRQGYIVSTGLPEKGNQAAEKIRWRLSSLKEHLGRTGHSRLAHQRIRPEKSNESLRSNFTKETYLAAIARTQEYITAGDIYQANISQRFEKTLTAEPWAIYKKLRKANPAPFAAFLNFPEVKVISSSPERFLKVTGNRVETRPIKGTMPRGDTPREDQALAKALIASQKDQAEHVMIVDLERNDLGRVCKPGSVEVPELASLERYATVHHLVSTVTGTLRPNADAISLLTASFPGGSITGAPKIRAMEIIDELEPTKRSLYTGSIGYLSFSGDMDLNIAIRTIMATDKRLFFQVGGGIVADSDPEAEYQETLYKGQALLETVR